MYVCVELYEKDPVIVNYRCEPLRTFNFRFSKYKETDCVWKKEENKDHDYLYVAFCVDDNECYWDLQDADNVGVGKLFERYSVFTIRIPKEENMVEYFIDKIEGMLRFVNK